MTRPPPPRRAWRSPSASTSNFAGPRLETITRRWSVIAPTIVGHPRKAPITAPRRPGYVSRSVKRSSQSRSRRGVRKCSRACSLPVRPRRLASSGSSRISIERWAAASAVSTRIAGDPVLDLQRDPADVAADRGPPLPQRLGDRQAESLADRLLHADVGLGLEGVDLDRADVVEVVEDLDVRVAVGVAEGPVEEVPALGVVGRHRADQRQLRVRDGFAHRPVGVDHAHRVLPGVEAGDLADQRPVGVDPELLADEGRVLGRERHVLRRQRVDRRRADLAGSRRRDRRGRTAACARRWRRSR